MQFETPLTFVRSLKGAPISILVACMFAKKALTNSELQMWTGYRDEAITESTKLLCTLGWLVAHSRVGPWSLGDGRQLPLMSVADELAAVAGVEDGSFGYTSSGFSGTLPPSCSSSESKLKVPSIEPEEEEEESSGFSGTLRENKKVLDEAGVREPARSRLAGLAHVTPEFICGHVEQCKAEGMTVGTAIHRIEYNWPLPEKSAYYKTVTVGRGRREKTILYTFDVDQVVADFTGHDKGCGCGNCSMGRACYGDMSRFCCDCKQFNCNCESED